jgi:hypothetical protein
LTAFATTALVQAAFGKTPSEIVWHASEISLATLVSTAAFSQPFLHTGLNSKRLSRSLLIASAGLLLVYPIFAAIHSLLTDRAQTFSEVAGTVIVVPVFALFSAPIAWPITLLFAWLWHRRLQRYGIGTAA